MTNVDYMFVDEIEKELFDKSFSILLDPKHSSFRKEVAVEFMAKFLKYKDIREKFQVIYNAEQNKELKSLMKKALEDHYAFDIEVILERHKKES